MISDRYILKPSPNNIERILDISEHMAACYGFNAKELLLIRLIAEEMIMSVHSGLLLSPGEMWFSVEDGMFTITAAVGTDVFGMPKEQRKKLLELASPPKKSGLFGLVQEFMDYIATADDAINLQGFVASRYGKDAEIMPPTEEWSTDGQSISPQEGEFNLEMSLLKGFADDVCVVNKGKTLEISVMKKIHFSFMFDYISSGK